MNDKMSDMTLNVITTQTSIPAHQMVLVVNSVFFRSKFDFDRNAKVSTVQFDVEDFNESCIRAMLEFMYTKNIARHMPTNLDDKLELIVMSDFYQIPRMHEVVAPLILKHISPGNVIKILATGYEFRSMSDVLAKRAGKWLRTNLAELSSKKKSSSSLAVDRLADLLKYALEETG